MMGFGDFIAKAAKSASESALNAGRTAANWTAEQTGRAYQAYQQGKEWAGEKAKEGIADGLGVGMAGWQQASATWRSAKEYVGDKLQSTKSRIGTAVDKAFSRNGQPSPTQPESPIQPCPLQEASRKEQTRRARQKLIAAGEESANPDVRDKAAELKRDMDAVEEAKLSDHIYCVHDAKECTAQNSDIPGFKDVSDNPRALDSIGLKPADLRMQGSNFRAAVFQKTSPPFSPEEAGYVVVFKGTSPDNAEDWRNNFRQGLNAESPFYRKAVEIGGNVLDGVGNPPNPKVSFAGHSLGGGLASAAAKASGLPANTFNAAGLHPATVAHYGGNPADAANIRAYHVPGDPLTGANEKGLGLLGWKPEAIQPPFAAGKSDTVKRALEDQAIPAGKDDAYFHSMPVVIRALERRKGADEERLRKATLI